MHAIAEAAQPITGRGVGYKLFTRGLIPSMARTEMQRVYRLLKEARERGKFRGNGSLMRPAPSSGCQHGPIPPSMPAASPNPIAAISGISSPIASRSGPRRAPCAACLPRCSIIMLSASFRCMDFSSATTVHDIAEDDDGRELIVLYVGDFDPSGMFMSEEDLPAPVRQIRRRSRQAKANCADASNN